MDLPSSLLIVSQALAQLVLVVVIGSLISVICLDQKGRSDTGLVCASSSIYI